MGLTEEGADLAQSVLHEVAALIARVGDEAVKAALKEATFRADVLP